MAYHIEFDIVMWFLNTGNKPDYVSIAGTYISNEVEEDEAEAELYEYWESDDRNILSQFQIDEMSRVETEYASVGASLVDIGCKVKSIKEI